MLIKKIIDIVYEYPNNDLFCDDLPSKSKKITINLIISDLETFCRQNTFRYTTSIL